MTEIESFPKAEVHLHLEGSIHPSVFLELSRKYQTEYNSYTTEEIVQELFQYEAFPDFLKTYKVVCEHLREPADYLRILDWLAEYFVRENIWYAEIIYAPSIPWKSLLLKVLISQGVLVVVVYDLS